MFLAVPPRRCPSLCGQHSESGLSATATRASVTPLLGKERAGALSKATDRFLLVKTEDDARLTALAALTAASVAEGSSLGSAGQFVRCEKKRHESKGRTWQCKSPAGNNTMGFCDRHFDMYCRKSAAARRAAAARAAAAPPETAAEAAAPSEPAAAADGTPAGATEGATVAAAAASSPVFSGPQAEQALCSKRMHSGQCKNPAGNNTRGLCNEHFDMHCVQPTAVAPEAAAEAAAADEAAAAADGAAEGATGAPAASSAVFSGPEAEQQPLCSKRLHNGQCENPAGNNTRGFCNEHFEMHSAQPTAVAASAASPAAAVSLGSAGQFVRCKNKRHYDGRITWQCKNPAGDNRKGFCEHHFDMCYVKPAEARAARAAAKAAAPEAEATEAAPATAPEAAAEGETEAEAAGGGAEGATGAPAASPAVVWAPEAEQPLCSKRMHNGQCENPAGSNTRGFCNEHFEMHSQQPTAVAASPAAAVSLGSAGQFVRCKKKRHDGGRITWQCKSPAGDNRKGFCDNHFDMCYVKPAEARAAAKAAAPEAEATEAAPATAPEAAAEGETEAEAAGGGAEGATGAPAASPAVVWAPEAEQPLCSKRMHNGQCENPAGSNTRGFLQRALRNAQCTANSSGSVSSITSSSRVFGIRRAVCPLQEEEARWGENYLAMQEPCRGQPQGLLRQAL